MDLSKYRELLGRFYDVVLACGPQTARVPRKWLAEFDRDLAQSPDENQLTLHLNQVRRSANAIAIIAGASISTESLRLSEGLIDSAVSELLAELARIQEALLKVRRVLQDRGVQGLADQSLSSVGFVMDYSQFDFNGSVLTTFLYPEWIRGGEKLGVGDSGYRDALCGLIGATVSHVVETADCLVLTFTNGEELTVSLRADEAPGPENATFISATGLIWVW